MLLTLPMAQAGREGYTFSVIVYTLVFFGYAFFRIRKALMKKCSYTRKAAVNGILTLTVTAVSLITFFALPKHTNKQSDKETHKSFSISAVSSTESATEAVTSSVVTVPLLSEALTTETSSETSAETTVVTTTSEAAQIITEETTTVMTAPPTEPQYIYNNGEFSATAYGYDGDVHITITIENDVITNISGWSDESDEWYFDSASGQVIPAILASQNADVDAYSGATYSSKAIMEAVRKALESAKR